MMLFVALTKALWRVMVFGSMGTPHCGHSIRNRVSKLDSRHRGVGTGPSDNNRGVNEKGTCLAVRHYIGYEVWTGLTVRRCFGFYLTLSE